MRFFGDVLLLRIPLAIEPVVSVLRTSLKHDFWWASLPSPTGWADGGRPVGPQASIAGGAICLHRFASPRSGSAGGRLSSGKRDSRAPRKTTLGRVGDQERSVCL